MQQSVTSREEGQRYISRYLLPTWCALLYNILLQIVAWYTDLLVFPENTSPHIRKRYIDFIAQTGQSFHEPPKLHTQ